MKQECSIVQDLLPLYVENMVNADTAAFIRAHIETCPDCAAALAAMQGDKEAEAAEARRRENDAQVIAAMRKKVARRVFRSVAAVAAAAAIVCGAVLAYVGVGRPATTADVSLSAKTEDGLIVLEVPAGKSLAFDSKTEDILDEAGEVCGQRTTLYNLECHNSFSREATTLDWRVPLDEEYWEVVVELEDGTLRASTGERAAAGSCGPPRNKP